MQTQLSSLSVQSTEGQQRFSELKFPMVLYFYPKDNTPGCTDESKQFASMHQQFLEIGYNIYGVSRDPIALHEKFIKKLELPFPLISDPSEALCQLFDVIKEKKFLGKTYMGIERSTFVINSKLEIIHEWRKVKVKDHALAVYQTLTQKA